jgi:nucleoside-diphosphate-sugar epimerase
MDSKIVTVLGATGVQGGSVIDNILNDSKYKVRAVTRSPWSEEAESLTLRGAEVVQADANDIASLIAAFKNSSIIFAVTDFFENFQKVGPEKAMEIETGHGLNIAKAAAATSTLEHFVWSTLPDARSASSGKILVPNYESKNAVDRYIRSQSGLLSKTTFFIVGYYAANFYFPAHTPVYVPTANKYIQLNSWPDDVLVKSIGDARHNVGIFFKSIIEQPEKTTNGKVILAHTEDITVGEMLQAWARAQGKTAEFVRIDKLTFNAIWPAWGKECEVMMEFFAWANENGGVGTELLTREELGITSGLICTEQAFSTMKF